MSKVGVSAPVLSAALQRENIAFHEAAHAIVAVRLGLSVTSIGMWADGSGSIGGFVRHDASCADRSNDALDRAYHVVDGVVACAGHALEELLDRPVGERKSVTDDMKVELAIDRLGATTAHDRVYFRETFRGFARGAVADYLPAIGELARALIECASQVRVNDSPWAVWSATLEGERLERLLS